MARFLVERTFPDGLDIATTPDGAERCLSIVGHNAEVGVTWLTSYVTEDKTKTVCVYDAPDSEAIRRAATRNGLPIDSITRVRVLDPYFYV
jgi:Nickel responsive protein SCO4226-like